MNMFIGSLPQIYMGLIEKEQGLPVVSNLEDVRKLLLKKLWIVT